MSLKILCAIDDREPSRRAASVAIDLTRRLSAKLILCMINPAVLPGRGPIIYLWTEKNMNQVIDNVMRSARVSGLWDVRGETGRAIFAADGVVDCADACEADYIIVGASDRSAIMQALSGSVSREISLKANCPVLIVRRIRGQPNRSTHGLLERMIDLAANYLRSRPALLGSACLQFRINDKG
jgi:nucleotide-binding universal stress UspA family protein